MSKALIGIQIASDKCESCLYRLKYPRKTRERILSDVARVNGFVRCHIAQGVVMCTGFAQAFPECTALQIARRLGQLHRTNYIHVVDVEKKS